MYRLQAKELQSIDPKDLTFHRPGKMYEVNIHADPEHFLDWDAPLNAQSPQVQEKIKQAWPLADAMDWQTPDFYKAAPYAQRSQELREAGIPGIKYLRPRLAPDRWRQQVGRSVVRERVDDAVSD